MKRKKLLWMTLVLVLLAAVVVISILHRNRGVVTVQTQPVVRDTVTAIVTATGQIKPKNYADISSNSVGQITHLYVHEGDRVKKGERLAELWNVQQHANVEAMTANLHTLEAQAQAQSAALATSRASLQQSQAQYAQQKANWRRAQGLYHQELISRSDYDSAREAYDAAAAQVQLDQARIQQSAATVHSAHMQIRQASAQLQSAKDQLSLTIYTSPLNGLVVYLPVHVGDTAVLGIENSPGSLLMRVADMSIVTAHLQVDESDITHVRVGQPATVSVDAYGSDEFPGTVTEVGDTALLQSTGVAATTSGGQANQEAKDFKVVITLNRPPDGIRPGLSCTGHIITAVAHNALSIPIQAIVERDPAQLKPGGSSGSGVAEAATPGAVKKNAKPIQGVFVIRGQEAVFVPVQTGVTGEDHIQVLHGLQASDQVVTGPYSALRTLKNHARIKINNVNPAAAAQANSAS